jgi:hypothetical protein
MKTEEVKWRIVIDNVFQLGMVVISVILLWLLIVMFIGFFCACMWFLFLQGWNVI